MALVIKELLSSDQINEVIEKLNYNFNQILLNGGGDMGLPGKDSTARGIPGIRGSNWYTGEDNPNSLIFSDLLENDLYLDGDTGNVWICINPLAINKWEPVLIDGSIILNLKGPQGDTPTVEEFNPSIYTKKDLYINTTQLHHFYYVNREELETNVDFRPFLLGGYVNNLGMTYNISNTQLLNTLHGENGVLFLYNPTGASGGKQIKLFGENTKDITYAPEIFSDTNDILTIRNNRQVIDFDVNVLEGINLTTTDTNINLNSTRNINILVDGSPLTSAANNSEFKN